MFIQGWCSRRELWRSPAGVMIHTDFSRTCHFGGSNLAIWLDKWLIKLGLDVQVIGADWSDTIYKSWPVETWRLLQALCVTWQVETWPVWKVRCDKLRLQVCKTLENRAHPLDPLDRESVYSRLTSSVGPEERDTMKAKRAQVAGWELPRRNSIQSLLSQKSSQVPDTILRNRTG